MGPCCALLLALVYRCSVGGVTTYSDRPCSPDAAAYEPDTSRVSTYEPPPVTQTAKPAQPARTSTARRRGSDHDDQLRHAAACERLQNSLREVAARMRAGYNVKQGEQLRARKAKLEQQRRAEKCR
jgi:hypothetical protein